MYNYHALEYFKSMGSDALHARPGISDVTDLCIAISEFTGVHAAWQSWSTAIDAKFTSVSSKLH